jgi:hypothetical protein
MVKKFLTSYGTNSLVYLHEPTTGPILRLVESTHKLIPYFFYFHFNIIFPSVILSLMFSSDSSVTMAECAWSKQPSESNWKLCWIDSCEQ